MILRNDCDETGKGHNEATCFHDEPSNFVGPITQTNNAQGADTSTVTQSNEIQVTQNMQGVNDCDESGDGSNFASCQTHLVNEILSVEQTNDFSASGAEVHDQSNFFGVTQNLAATNDCDESGNGDNNANCSITSTNHIGAVSQVNTGSSNILDINQDGQATNNCDDTTSGDNDFTCTINLSLTVPDALLVQDGDDELHFNQHENLLNTCSAGGTCSININRDDPDPELLQTLAAFSNEGGEDQQTQEQAFTVQADSVQQEDTDKSSATTNSEPDDGNSQPSTEVGSISSVEKVDASGDGDSGTADNTADNTGDGDGGDDGDTRDGSDSSDSDKSSDSSDSSDSDKSSDSSDSGDSDKSSDSGDSGTVTKVATAATAATVTKVATATMATVTKVATAATATKVATTVTKVATAATATKVATVAAETTAINEPMTKKTSHIVFLELSGKTKLTN